MAGGRPARTAARGLGVWRFGWGRYHSWGGPAAGLDLHAGLAWLPPEAVADELQGALLPRG